MLKYKVGDLIEAARNGEVNYIGHGCNCYTTMGSGIAPLIKAAFPYAYKVDCQTGKGDITKLGSFSEADPLEFDMEGPVVFNLYTQYGYWGRNQGKRDLNYDAIYNALSAMAERMHDFDKGDQERHVVGLPKIGAGYAGGDWDIIELIIKKTLCAQGIDVIIYVLTEEEIPSNMQKLITCMQETLGCSRHEAKSLIYRQVYSMDGGNV
ncbi:putative phosphatase [Klebsiella phage 05F01]|nr:putative phosphatase [Klebsiella phage 05F01]